MIDALDQGGRGEIGRPPRQCRRCLPGAGEARRAARHRHRPDLGARSGQRLPAGGLDRWANGGRSARAIPKAVEKAARASMKRHVAAMVDFWNAGVPTLDYGNNIRQMAKEEGLENAFAFPGFVPAYIRPLFCRGIGPFRWAALSGDPEDIYRTDAKVKELIPDDAHLHNWLDMARERIAFQGLPARICWVGLGQRAQARPRLQRDGAHGRAEGAGRHRPRPSRLRLGRLAEPRDRGDARRLRRGLRLAAAERAAQLRLRRDLGVAPPWRRRRHGLLAACRHGDLLRRHARTPTGASPACSGTTRRPASCAMPMRATRSPSTAPASTSSTCPEFFSNE